LGKRLFIISITLSTFFIASSVVNFTGSLWAPIFSSILAGRILKGSPNNLKYSCRRREPEARIIVSMSEIITEIEVRGNSVNFDHGKNTSFLFFPLEFFSNFYNNKF
jgi:hypothetical protein